MTALPLVVNSDDYSDNCLKDLRSFCDYVGTAYGELLRANKDENTTEETFQWHNDTANEWLQWWRNFVKPSAVALKNAHIPKQDKKRKAGEESTPDPKKAKTGGA